MATNKDSIADSNDYKEFELRHNRHLNMVGESVSIPINISQNSSQLLNPNIGPKPS